MVESPPSVVPSRPTQAGPGVYPPREDSFLLLPFAEVAPGTKVAEVGAGAGLVALAAARAGARVVATDRNPTALRMLRANARSEGLDVTAVRTDLLRGLGRFDRVLANPPYLPTRPEERDPDRWINLALDGGPDGCRVMARLVRDLVDHLAPHGRAFVVVSSVQDAGALTEILTGWAAQGGSHCVVASRALEGERLDVLEFGHDEAEEEG
jgi:release factor glutamine methyltransferase